MCELIPRKNNCEFCNKKLSLKTNYCEIRDHFFCDTNCAFKWCKRNFDKVENIYNGDYFEMSKISAVMKDIIAMELWG